MWLNHDESLRISARAAPNRVLSTISFVDRKAQLNSTLWRFTLDMIHPDVIGRSAEIQLEFQQAKPFRHVVIDGFLLSDNCESLLRDFPAFDEKRATNELGLIGRKAVVEYVSDISQSYRTFYDYINSVVFLNAMSKLTGIQDLIADKTLFGGGTHDNLSGQGLDVHVDFNIDERTMLHRRINLIIYLNKEWEEAWGGAIELHSNPRDASVNETVSFLPLFNRAVIFETNEYSWHGFKRITLPPDKQHLSRKSFSIYLYTKDRPAEEVLAPHTTFYVPQPLPSNLRVGHTLTEQDMLELQIRTQGRDGLLTMYQKLLIEKEQRLRDFMKRYQGRDGDYAGIMNSPCWRLVEGLHRLRYRLRQLF
ncbi:MAG TPA: 2OG-Fe(II) oxygenase [Casimicrobiaceae bacterium]|nr:2OG-Fe(II) oxygenase [Casimicrobiaceae bacterium]